jgi:predicted porin
MKHRRSLVVLALGVTVVTASAFAQDSHYWTLQYGPRSSLLGGVVIGSVDDVSATYYNPGALAVATDLAFAVSANVFEYSGVGLMDGGGEGVDLGTSRSGLRPSLVAGAIKRDLFGAGVLAYSVLTRMRGSQDLAGFAILSGEQIPPDAQLDDVAGLVQFEGQFNDVWAGLSYSHGLGSQFGLGLSWYTAFRSQRRRGETVAHSIGIDGTGYSAISIKGGKYSTVRTLFKFGAFGSAGPFSGGITLTSPSIHIAGSGELGIDSAIVGPGNATLATNIQANLPAEYKSPLSVGAGGAWRIGGTRIHASAEWYDAIASYVVIQGEDFVSQEPEEVIEVDAVQALDEVLNWGVGIEHAFSRRFSAYASYYTDNSGLNSDKRVSLSVLPFDIQTVSAGTDFVISSARFTLGFGYGWGEKVDQNLTDALQQEDEGFEATFIFRSIRLIFGFEIGI